VPSSPYDAKGLLIQAIRDDDPVMFFEHKMLYDVEEDVPEGAYTIPFGEANVVREGKDVTIVALGRMVMLAMQAADALARDGISCEVIDPRTTSPLDADTILDSVENTGRLVVVDEAHPRCSKAPIQMVTAPHTPVPFSPALEDLYLPNAEKIASAVRKIRRKAAA
jgi:acetoin:2,6-dichlorophenolindophenol oxidoreductase subunit beta